MKMLNKSRELFEKSLEMKQQKLYNESIKQLENIINLDPQNIEALIEIGDSYENLKEMKNALDYYNKALRIDNQNPLALAKKGYVLQYLGRNEEGLELCRKAAIIEPKSALILSIAGEAFITKDTKIAMSYYRKSLKINSSYPKAIFGIGMVFVYENKVDEAIKCYEKASKIDSKFKNILYAQVNGLYEMNDYSTALKELQQFLSFDKDSNQYKSMEGKILMEMGLLDEALVLYRQIIASDHENFEANFNLGRIYHLIGKNNLAIESYLKSVSNDPNSAEALTNISAIYCDNLKDYNEALIYIEKALGVNNRLVNAWINKGFILSHLDNIDKAMKCFDKALEIEPDSSNALLSKGGILNDKLGMHDEAIKYFNIVLSREPYNLICIWNLSQAYIGKKDYDVALNYINQLLAYQPNHEGALYQKAKIFIAIDNFSEANELANRIKEINHESQLAKEILAKVHIKNTGEKDDDLICIITELLNYSETAKRYLKIIADKNDLILANIFVNKLLKIFSMPTQSEKNLDDLFEDFLADDDQKEKFLSKLDESVKYNFAKYERMELVQWLVKKGAKLNIKF